MRKLYPAIVIILSTFFVVRCTDTQEAYDAVYHNLKAVVISKGGYSEKNGKINSQGNSLLIRSLTDTTMYTELTGYNWTDLQSQYGSKLYWTKKVGDTLFFETIRKDRFWHTNKLILPVDTLNIETEKLKQNIKTQDSLITQFQIRVNKLIDVSSDLVKEAKSLRKERDSLNKILQKLK